MPRVLVLSDYFFHETYPPVDFECCSWGKVHPSIIDFEGVVLDLNLNSGVVDIGGFPFYGLFDEVLSLLRAGGIVVCLNHVTSINNRSQYQTQEKREHAALYRIRRQDCRYEDKYQENKETNYDWLDQGFLQVTQLDVLQARPGSNLQVLTGVPSVQDYLKNLASNYHKIIKGVRIRSDFKSGQLVWNYRGAPDYGSRPGTIDEVEVLGVTSFTKQLVAASIKYMNLPGRLVILPTYKADESYRAIILNNFREIISFYLDRVKDTSGVVTSAPEWVPQHRIPPSQELQQKIEKLEVERHRLSEKRDEYDGMLMLLYGYGNELDKAVQKFFGSEWLGLAVTGTQKGDRFDLEVNHTSGKNLMVEVTGITGKFDSNNQHFSDVLAYLPEHTRKNQNGRIERVVIAVNTYRDTEPSMRDQSEDFTPEAVTIAKDNHFCLIRAADLYKLWQDSVEQKRTSDDIFDLIFNTEGIFTYTPT